MKRFVYRGKDKNAHIVTGEVEASSEEVAARLIRKRGLVVISLKPKSSLFSAIKGRIKFSDVVNFTRQLSTMINAGLPITDALLILRNQASGNMQKVIAQILANVEGGESLSSSMEKHPKVFNKTYIALVRSGEVGGVLDEVLLRLADNLEKEREFKGKVKGALIYPVIIVIGMVIVAFIMMVFVIPRLTVLYEDFDAELPLPTQVLITVSDFMAGFWWVILIMAGIAGYMFIQYRKTSSGARQVDELMFKIPIFGDLQRQVILTELTRTLSLMVGAGIPIIEGLHISADAIKNVIISDALEDAAKKVEKGFPLAYSFAKHPDAFPFILSQMISVGEETGKMDEVLDKVSKVFEIESEQKVKALTASIEPLIMIVLGVGVGFLVISIILPIYNLTAQI